MCGPCIVARDTGPVTASPNLSKLLLRRHSHSAISHIPAPPLYPSLPPHSGDSGDLPDLSELLLRRHSHSATSSPARVRPSATLGASPFSGGSGGGGVRSSYQRELSGGSHGGGAEDAPETLTRLSSRSVPEWTPPGLNEWSLPWFK